MEGGVRNGVHLPAFLGMLPAVTTPSQNPAQGASDSDRTVFPLSGIARAVGKMLDERTGGRLFWVRAEISQCSFSGKHCYLDLVEEEGGTRLAQFRGTIWGSRLGAIRKELGGEFEEVLKPGREIVFAAHMAFHAVYGFSLNIQSIDLDVLLGEMERRRKETFDALKKEGAIGRNARLPLMEVPQRIVLIGSGGTAGHTDFLTHLTNNPYGYVFDLGCLDAPVQGGKARGALVDALNRAGRAAMRTPVDAVVLLRGGGAKLDLDIFNDLTLCRTIAAMDVPVVTGIGHETDSTLVDFVAHSHCKTPTAVADWLVDRMVSFESSVGREGRAVAAECRAQLSEQSGWLQGMQSLLVERPLSYLRRERGELHHGANAIVRRTRTSMSISQEALVRIQAEWKTGVGQLPKQWKSALEEVESGIHREATRQLRQQEERMAAMKATLALLGPGATLKRGFSITRLDEKSIRDVKVLTPGMEVETELESGTFKSEVKEVSPAEKGNTDRT